MSKRKNRRVAQSSLVCAQDLRFIRTSFRRCDGYAHEDYKDKPVIAIINTWSDINKCHSHFRQRAEEVKRGVWQRAAFR